MDQMREQGETIESKSKNRVQIWRFVTIAVVVLLLVSNIAWLLRSSALSQENEILHDTYSVEYLNLNSITYTTFQNKLVSGEDFIVAIARPSCHDCREFAGTFLEILDKFGIRDDVYYLNVTELRKDTEAWKKFREEYQIGGTPSYVRIAGGKLVSSTGWTKETGISPVTVENWFGEQTKNTAKQGG